MAKPRTIIALCLAYLCLLASAARKPSNAILLSKVKTLTLRGDQKTTARRTSAVPQLKCVGGSGKGYYDVDVMRCTNQGAEYDTEDIQWTCQASLPPEFKLGSTDVSCEGYDSPEDPYVLKGSCGVEFRLILTEAGEEKYGRGWIGDGSGFGDGGVKTMGERVWTGLFWVIFIGIVVTILYSAFTGGGAQANINLGRRQGWGGGGGGGGWGGDDGHDDPPPPYSPRAPPRSKNTAYSTRPGEAWRPGFWTGTAAGAAAGYAMGNRNQTNYNAPAQAGPSNWFGGGGGSRGAGGGSSFGSSSSPSPSSSRHESTGFGGTRRR